MEELRCEPKMVVYGIHLVDLLKLVFNAKTSSVNTERHFDWLRWRSRSTERSISLIERMLLSANPFPGLW